MSAPGHWLAGIIVILVSLPVASAQERLGAGDRPDWQAAGDTRLSASFTLEGAAEAGPVTLMLNLPGPGYVSVTGAGTGRTVFTDGAGRSINASIARIGVAQGASLAIEGAGDALITVHFEGETDISEPNDDPLLAWPVDLGVPAPVVIHPPGDVDHFALRLAQGRRVQVMSQAPFPLAMRFLEAASGNLVAEGPNADLPAGDLILEVRARQAEAGSAEPFLMVVTGSPPVPEASPQPAPRLSPGHPVLVTPDVFGRAEFGFTVDEAGLFTVSLSNAADGAVTQFTHASGYGRRSRAVHLGPGEITLKLEAVYGSGLPIFLTLHREPVTEAGEPNDFPGDATPLDLDAPVTFRLPAAAPVNWYALRAPRGGQVFLVADRADTHCEQLWITFEDGNGGFTAAPRHADGLRLIFGPIDITPDASLPVALSCDRQDADTTITLTATPRGQSTNGSVYLVGLEIDAAVRDQLAAISALSDVHFLETPEAGDLEARLAEIAAIETRRRNSGGWLVWLLLVIALAGGGAGFAAWRARQVST
jgi:hypothetical protein